MAIDDRRIAFLAFRQVGGNFHHLGRETNLAPVAWAQPAQLRPGQVLYAGDAPLDPGDYAIPYVTDWDGDGRKDLIVGYRYADKVALYLNVGSDANPALTNFINLQAGGADICHPSSGCGAPAPFACDYDTDGRRDLLVGEGYSGYVYFYRNTNTDAAPILAPGVALMVGTNLLSVGSRASPCVCDWDGDGLKDLLCGKGDGYVSFFKNTGTGQAPGHGGEFDVPAAEGDDDDNAVPVLFGDPADMGIIGQVEDAGQAR